MKRLKCNFTTLKQSTRLLKLGVPAWTADCFYPTKKSDMPIIIADAKVGWNIKYATPCWSVGRLIEIFHECSNYNTLSITSIHNNTYIDQLIELYEVFIDNINFSKLEE